MYETFDTVQVKVIKSCGMFYTSPIYVRLGLLQGMGIMKARSYLTQLLNIRGKINLKTF